MTRYDKAAETAAYILNVLWGMDAPKHEIFSRLVALIMAAMPEISEPSEN